MNINIKDITCTFTGHRPSKLYGYDLNNPKYQVLAQALAKHLRMLIAEKGVRRFISGGAIGFDTVAFFVVEQMKREYKSLEIENILAIPFEKQYCKWRKTDVDRYNRMKLLADKVIYIDELKQYQLKNAQIGVYNPIKMQKRNEYMVDESSYIVALWDDLKIGGTYNCIKYLKDKRYEQYNNISVMNPKTFYLKAI